MLPILTQTPLCLAPSTYTGDAKQEGALSMFLLVLVACGAFEEREDPWVH